MHVPLILAILQRDVSSLRKIAQELTSVTPDLAMQTLENVSSPLLYVTTTTHVPLMFVTSLPEDANTLLRTVMITMHAPLTAATEILDCVYILLKSAMTTTFVPETLATSRPENASMKISLLK